jgi:hypothetical protein
MFRRFTLLLVFFALALAPLQAGTIHEVLNQTFTGTTALATTDLLTPPTSDRSYLITIYYSLSGTSALGVKDTVSPYFTWTDDVGTEQLGNGLCPWNENGTPKKCTLAQTYGPWLQNTRHANQRWPARGHLPRPRAGQQPSHYLHPSLESRQPHL